MSKTRHMTVAFREWTRDRRIDIPATKNDVRTPTVMIRLGLEIIEMSRYEFAAALEALSTAMTTGGEPERWRDIIKTAEGDVLQELRGAVRCDTLASSTDKFPDAHLLVVGFETKDQAEGAKAALSAMLHFHPPVDAR